ncbi:hypothetical protein HNQ56_002539 [Anaerotaenia torta]|uniref:hypothetical protein n=1 Tax=Anaerotaenia torta TaxID=433293 RepID=UPI003D214C1E
MEQIQRRKGDIPFSLHSIMVGLTVIYCVLFPADKINIKEIILFFTLVVCSPAIISALKQKDSIILAVYGIMYPLVTTLVSITIGNSTIYGALSYSYVWVFVLLIPVVEKYNIDLKKPFIFATTIVALITDFIFLADVFGLVSIYRNPLVLFLSNMNELQWGKGSLATFGYSIFYKSSPLIFFTYGYTLYHKKYFHAAILLLAFFACGTRANLLVALFVTAAIPLICSRTPMKKMIVIMLVFGASLIILPNIIDRLTALNTLKYDRSESIKIAAITSIFDHLNKAPYRYIFGSGVGSYFYSSGRNAYVDVVEVSYFDYFRQVGIIGFSFLAYFLIRPIKWLIKNERWLLIVYVGYLAVAFTNPLLVTSTSFMAYIIVYSCGMSKKRESLLKRSVLLSISKGDLDDGK